MNKPLSLESVFNELTGEEVRSILLSRFDDLLSRVPEFQRHLTLPRVRMTLNLRLEVHGRNPPAFQINDEIILRINPLSPVLAGPATSTSTEFSETLSINGDSSTRDGQPPDQLRVEHSLPVLIPTRTPQGVQDVPTLIDGAKYLKPELRGRVITIEQDFGPARMRTGGEGINNMPLVGEKNTHGGSPDAPIQTDFRTAVKVGNESRTKQG